MSEKYEPAERSANPEMLAECLISQMDAVNNGDQALRAEVLDCLVASRGEAAALICKRAGCRMVVEGGVVYGASNCSLVQGGEMSVPASLL